jgi:hypothetical protein
MRGEILRRHGRHARCAGQPHPPREVADTLTGLIIDGLPVAESEDQADKLNGPDRPWPRRRTLLLHQDQTGPFP